MLLLETFPAVIPSLYQFLSLAHVVDFIVLGHQVATCLSLTMSKVGQDLSWMFFHLGGQPLTNDCVGTTVAFVIGGYRLLPGDF